MKSEGRVPEIRQGEIRRGNFDANCTNFHELNKLDLARLGWI